MHFLNRLAVWLFWVGVILDKSKQYIKNISHLITYMLLLLSSLHHFTVSEREKTKTKTVA